MQRELVENSSRPNCISRFNLIIALLCGLLILAHFFSSFFPKSRLWGINHLAYFPLWVRAVFTLVGLSILLPWVNIRVYRILQQILSPLQRIVNKGKVLGYVFLSLFSVFIFWLLRARTYFLGDGYAHISSLKSGKYLLIRYEPLEIFAHLYLYKFLRLFFIPSAESIYIGLSILAGGLFVFILFLLARSLSEDGFDRLFIFSIFLFSGASQLFLGYVEHYTLTYVSIFAYLYFSLRYLQGKVRILLPIIFCTLAIGFHFSSVHLLPSLFFLFALKRKKGGMVFNLKKALPFLSILAFILGLSVYYIWNVNPGLSQVFIPLLQGRPYAPEYTLFTSSHLLDVLNQHLLLSGTGLILLLSLAMVCRKRINFQNPIIVFLLLASLAIFLYHFLVDPRLGAAVDWDLFFNVALAYTMLGVYLFINLIKTKRYSAVVLISTAILSILPWFLINANAERSTDRFRDLLDLDLDRSLYGRHALVDHYLQQKRLREAEEVQANINRLFPEDSLARAAGQHMRSGDYEKAEDLLKKAIEINPNFIDPYNNLGIIYLMQDKVDEAIDAFQRVVDLYPFFIVGRLNLGRALLKKGRTEEALEHYKRAEKLGAVEPEVCLDIAYIYFKIGEMEEAVKSYKKALKLNPEFYTAHFGLGQIYLSINSQDKAQFEFEQVVRLKPDYAPVYYNLGMIYARKGLKAQAVEQFKLFLKYSSDEVANEKVRELIKNLRS